MVTLIKNNSLTGYSDNDENGQSKYETLAGRTFYASFTVSDLTIEQEEYFWKNFGRNCCALIRRLQRCEDESSLQVGH